jgi:hypothetical protein
MRNSVSAARVLAVALAVLVRPAVGETRNCTVFRAKTPPRLDACFDDACWRGVPWQTGFTFLGGAEVGAPFQTQFAMVWDDQCLYVAVRALEPETGRLLARAPRGSNDLFRDDHLEIFLCPDTGRSDWRQFVVNPLGRALDFTYAAKKVAARQVMSDAAPWRCACASRTACWEVALAIPLAELKIEPREGVVFSANVVRSRAVEQPEQYRTTWAPLLKDGDESGAFVAFRLGGLPPPEAAGRSLAVDPSRDRVTTVPGDRFTGAVLGLDEDGWLRIRCPEFPNDVRVLASALDRIELPFAGPPGTGDRIALANGDFILGKVRSIGSEQTVVASDALGALTLPTPCLSEVRFSAAAQPFLDAPFDAGDMGLWMAVRGKWNFENGRLASPGEATDGGVIAAILPQEGPVTFEADVEAAEEAPLDCEMILFASESGWMGERPPAVYGPAAKPSQRSGVLFAFRGDGKDSVGVSNGAPAGRRDWSQSLRFDPPRARSVRLGCSCDPKDGTLRAWQDDQTQGPVTSGRPAPKDGRYVVFVAFSPISIKRLRVRPGVVPAGGAPPEPAAGSVQVTLTNGNAMTAQSVTLADGRFSLRTGHDEPQPEPGQVASIQFAAPNGNPSTPEAAAVRVVTSDGRFTLRSCTLSPDRLMGQSEILGALSIPRDRVRSIHFLRASP